LNDLGRGPRARRRRVAVPGVGLDPDSIGRTWTLNDRFAGTGTQAIASPSSSTVPHPRRTTAGSPEPISTRANPTDRWNAFAVAALMVTIAAGLLAAIAFHYLKV
jgi:hypothetical protein